MPRPKGSGNRSELIQLAIAGLDAQIQQLEAQIKELADKRKELSKGNAAASVKGSKASSTGAPARKKRVVSAATRRKLKEAAKARWAKARGEKVE